MTKIDLSNAIIYRTPLNEAETEVRRVVDRIYARKIKLLASGDSNTKLRKNASKLSRKLKPFRTLGLSLAPHTIAGCGNLCPFASAGCASACLNYCGMGSWLDSIHFSRIARTIVFREDRRFFTDRLYSELETAGHNAARAGFDLAVRLNVLSDVPWEQFDGLIDSLPKISFYDYTKWPTRFGSVRKNYWLTFSLSEDNESDALNVLRNCGNVAIPFADDQKQYVGNRSKLQDLPRYWEIGGERFEVFDADETDLRFLDVRGRKSGRIAGLRLKAPDYQARQRAIDSGFAQVWN